MFAFFNRSAFAENMRSRGCSFTIQNLPVHHWSHAHRIGGLCKIIPNELVFWSYAFDWTGKTAEGNSIRIKPGDKFKILKVDSRSNSSFSTVPSGYLVQGQNGEFMHIRHPQNTANVFSFQRYDFFEMRGKVHIDSIVNRIGNPDNVSDLGYSVLYSWKTEAVPVFYSTYDTAENSGYVEIEDYDGITRKRKIEWTSKTPRFDSYTVEPYHFTVTCDQDGYVIRVYDIIKDKGN